jgi:hypothetical protein
MEAQKPSGPRFQACATRQYLLDRKERLRSAVKEGPDTQRAAHLANDALVFQRRRFQHEESGCDLCRRIELQGAQ